jgi:hypothetical protein
MVILPDLDSRVEVEMPGSRPAAKPSLVDRLKGYSAVVAAAAALVAAIGAFYSQIRESPIVDDIKGIIAARPKETAEFTLEVAGKHYGDNPDDAAIASAVRAAADHKDDPFVILSRSDREFIQAVINPAGWELEYRAHEMEKPNAKPLLFGCTEPLPIDKVIKAMQLYRVDDKAWLEVCAWKRMVL